RYEEGEQALVAGQWQAALAAFEQVAADNPGFRDIQEKLIQTRDRYQRAQWYDAAISHNEAERWAEACRTWINVLRGQFDYRDGDAVERLLDATERLLEQYDEQSRQAHEMLLLFDALTAAVEGKDWERAIEIGERLLQLAPDLDYPQTWLARARDAQKAKLERPTPPPLDPRHLGTGDLPPLAVLADRYVILEKVAQGGTGAIYRARDQRRQDKVVAVKEMSGATIPPAERELAIESFQRVAAVLDQLEHPNMAQVTHHFQAWGRHYIVTEFIHGQTLAQMLKDRREPFSEEQMLAWAVQLCDVLSYLHSQEPKIIYRGLKPDNVMVERDTDTVKLVSFSIARFFKPGHDKDTLALGALGYAAPEQYGTAQTDERTDIYALGVTLHQLLTLHDPTTKMFVFPPVHQLNPLVSRHVAQAIAKAINRDPADRFQTALEMKKALLRH
ncbi:MAG: serine/threonine-protein kinase, partial [Chloroflexota bacterium]|nr:serine/threonine-protein kinase [Chloroflexota bacterium]